MDREKAYSILTKYLKNKNLQNHCLACEAAMKSLYKHLTPIEKQNSQEENKWGLSGLLHDVDYEIAQSTNQLDKHGLLIFTEDKELNTIPKDIAHAIKAHNFENTKVLPENLMDWGIYCIDQLTGLIVAGALVHPEKKLAPLTPEYILKRFKEKSFARGAKREAILMCEEKLGINLTDFVSLVLKAMQENHTQLGL